MVTASAKSERWWWLSFTDPTSPRGKQFIGACVVWARDLETAVASARVLGIHPRGKVHGQPLSEDSPPPQELRRKLVKDPDEIDRLVRLWVKPPGES